MSDASADAADRPDADLPKAWAELAAGFAELPLSRRLSRAAALAGRQGAVFTTSFGLEDQVITHAIAETGAAVRLATIDTGRLFGETHDVWAETENRYGVPIASVHPDTAAVEALVADQGANGFRRSVANRHACCHVRKVVPLRRILAGAAVWITGLRAGQSAVRRGARYVETDATHGVIKVNPLLDWDRERVERTVALEGIPYNVLHDRGFPSIGCQPCTRAVRVGEDERAGRWWWEADAARECGLHHDNAVAAE
ncbi:MAG: phosphoadenylyl-sulfate reductase [Alphaproteobacteria bacterium]|jgi:phosphoadenosine phosphosulfate reductase|nr:phosphoadenylyl-sulfate reductase [Alphaproteobacteria bacterium]